MQSQFRTFSLSAGVLLTMFGGALMGCQGDISELPPVHLNWNMDDQNRYDPQEPNPFFEDGRAMRPMVEGTVAVGHLKADAHLYAGKIDGKPAGTIPAHGPEGKPMTLDRGFLERGQERWMIYCAPCHDAGGTGNGIAVERGMMQPPSLLDERIMAMEIGSFFDIATNGVRNMAGYGKALSVRDRWAVAAYVRTLQLSGRASLDAVPADKAGSERWEIR